MTSSVSASSLADPRRWPAAAEAPADAVQAHRLAAASLAAATGQHAQALDEALDASIREAMSMADAAAGGRRLAAWLASAPSLDVYRQLWRAIARAAAQSDGEAVAATLFAIPLVIIAGVPATAGSSPGAVPGVLPAPQALAAVLQEHGALGGNRTFAIAGVLVAAEGLDVAALPKLLTARRRVLAEGAPLAFPPAPLVVPGGESVHLRFLVGSAIGAAGIDVTREASTGRWGRPLSQALAAQIAAPGATLLALPRPAQPPLAAVAQGRLAQRDVSAQLFASNAIRDLRARVGEPVAVISAHRADDAPGGGELRLSLSSPLSPRDAHGYRCPLLPGEAVADAAKMLAELLADARVADVRIVAGVHEDRDPLTRAPLLYKPGTLPPSGSEVN